MHAEVAALRAAEARMDREATEADRLISSLLPKFACNFVIAESIPPGAWCKLPWDWQSGVKRPVELRWGKPPNGLRGPVGICIGTLRGLANG